MLPPLPPSWDGFHPLVVHFPIALLVVAPLFVLLGAITGSRAMMVSALLLLLLGVAGAFAATSTGEEAYLVIDPGETMEILDPDYEYDEVAVTHGEQAEFARNVFAAIAGLYAFIVLLAYLAPSTARLGPRLVMGVIVLGLCVWGNLVMANAAHMGGELVHRYGVRAALHDLEAHEEEMGEEQIEEEDTTDEEVAEEEEVVEDAADEDPAAETSAEESDDTTDTTTEELVVEEPVGAE